MRILKGNGTFHFQDQNIPFARSHEQAIERHVNCFVLLLCALTPDRKQVPMGYSKYSLHTSSYQHFHCVRRDSENKVCYLVSCLDSLQQCLCENQSVSFLSALHLSWAFEAFDKTITSSDKRDSFQTLLPPPPGLLSPTVLPGSSAQTRTSLCTMPLPSKRQRVHLPTL